MSTRTRCERCGLLWPSPEYPHNHLTPEDCIRALQASLIRQRTIAADMGMDMSLHFLRVLEELAIDPDAGYQFAVHDSCEGKLLKVPAQHVSGIFASILSRYRDMSDWTPMEEMRKTTAQYAKVAGKCSALLGRVLGRASDGQDQGVWFDDEFAATLQAAVEEAEQLGAPPPDPPDS